MAIGAMIHTFTVQLADVDRGVYVDLTLRAARHPSETDAYMVTRVLAYCLEYEEGIRFGEGISSTDEPAVIVRDLTGAVTAWIEVGAPTPSGSISRASSAGARGCTPTATRRSSSRRGRGRPSTGPTRS